MAFKEINLQAMADELDVSVDYLNRLLSLGIDAGHLLRVVVALQDVEIKTNTQVGINYLTELWNELGHDARLLVTIAATAKDVWGATAEERLQETAKQHFESKKREGTQYADVDDIDEHDDNPLVDEGEHLFI